MKHRILALVLALVMLFTVCPVSALAEAAETGHIETVRSEIISNPLYPNVVATTVLQFPGDASGSETAPVTAYGSKQEVAEDIQEYMKSRSNNFSLYLALNIPGSADVKQTVNNAIVEAFDGALVHTGVPTEGDYLRWHWGRYQYEWSADYSGSTYYVDINFAIEYYTTASQEATMNQEVDKLLDRLNLYNATDYQKVRGIYDYICENIVYDYDNLNNDNYTLKYSAYAALVYGTAICQGYANLFYRLALELGVDARFIGGIGNGGPHGWNIVELDSLYYNLDSTWDAEYLAAGHGYKCFLVTDANFVDHSRDPEYSTSAFYAEYPMASRDYVPSDDPAPAPTEPTPTEPQPTEPVPTEPAPTEPQPTEPVPSEPQPTEPVPEEPSHTHSYGDWYLVYEPSSKTEGLERRDCACGDYQTRTLPRLTNPFTDVPGNRYFFEPILWAVNRGITSGLTKTTFGPNESCTRAQIVMFLWCANGRPEPKSLNNPFTDVKEGKYYYKAVLWAVESGITSGVTKTTFGPNQTCTRAQVVMFLWASQGRPEPVTYENYFSDIKSDKYYFRAVLWAVQNDITTGVGYGKFGPNQTCTRAQIVTFLYNTLAGPTMPEEEVPPVNPPEEEPDQALEHNKYTLAVCAMKYLQERANTHDTIYIENIYYISANNAGYPMVIVEAGYLNYNGREERLYTTALASATDTFPNSGHTFVVEDRYYVGCDAYTSFPYPSLNGFEQLDVDYCIEVFENTNFNTQHNSPFQNSCA